MYWDNTVVSKCSYLLALQIEGVPKISQNICSIIPASSGVSPKTVRCLGYLGNGLDANCTLEFYTELKKLRHSC